MAEEADLVQDQLRKLTRVLDGLRASSWRTYGEPEFRWMADPPAKLLIHTYLEHLYDPELFSQRTKPVFYAEVPAPPLYGRPATLFWLLKALLFAASDPAWDQRESFVDKQYRLEDAIRAKHVELIIVADIGHLVLPTGQVLADHMEWLLSLFQSEVRVPLVIVGDPMKVDRLLCSNERYITRFWRIGLPGEPELDLEVVRRLKVQLGFPDKGKRTHE